MSGKPFVLVLHSEVVDDLKLIPDSELPLDVHAILNSCELVPMGSGLRIIELPPRVYVSDFRPLPGRPAPPKPPLYWPPLREPKPPAILARRRCVAWGIPTVD